MDIKAFPDNTGYAPREEAWHAIDCDNHDGAPDTYPPCLVGWGPTAEAAIADLLEQMADQEDNADG